MLNDVLCTMAGVYGLSLYIDVDSDPESWNCAGNLGILGLGLGVVASFHALRKVVRTGDGALAKLKIVNSSRSKLGKQEDAGSARIWTEGIARRARHQPSRPHQMRRQTAFRRTNCLRESPDLRHLGRYR